MLQTRVIAFALLVLVPGGLFAVPPPWWNAADTRIISPGVLQENYAVLNLGQLKNVALQAKKYLDLQLDGAGGAGGTIDELIAGFTPEGGHTTESRAANYAPANLGQLKAVAKPFYDRLLAIGFDTRQSLRDHGALGWSFNYPWDPATPVAENYAPANLGQLKWVFSFDLQLDANLNEIPDWWEAIATNASIDTDGDGLTNQQESNLHTNGLLSDNPAVGLQVFGYTAP